MTSDHPIPELLRDAVSILESAGAEAALIGGCARKAYADVRPTKDVDFVVAVDKRNYVTLCEAARARGFLRATTVGGAPGEIPDLELVSLEDLIVYKLLAGRPQDRLDVLAMLTALEEDRQPIDWAYVEHWCAVWEASSALARLRAELMQA